MESQFLIPVGSGDLENLIIVDADDAEILVDPGPLLDAAVVEIPVEKILRSAHDPHGHNGDLGIGEVLDAIVACCPRFMPARPPLLAWISVGGFFQVVFLTNVNFPKNLLVSPRFPAAASMLAEDP